MPKVGKKEFPYTKAGKKAADTYAEATGQNVVNARDRSVKTYAMGGQVMQSNRDRSRHQSSIQKAAEQMALQQTEESDVSNILQMIPDILGVIAPSEELGGQQKLLEMKEMQKALSSRAVSPDASPVDFNFPSYDAGGRVKRYAEGGKAERKDRKLMTVGEEKKLKEKGEWIEVPKSLRPRAKRKEGYYDKPSSKKDKAKVRDVVSPSRYADDPRPTYRRTVESTGAKKTRKYSKERPLPKAVDTSKKGKLKSAVSKVKEKITGKKSKQEDWMQYLQRKHKIKTKGLSKKKK